MTLDTLYETGILWQDFQHKQLIDLLSSLEEKGEEKLDKEMFNNTVGFLVMYATHHFSLEQMYMEKYQYTDIENHIKEHNEFIGNIRKLREKYPTYSKEAAKKLLVTISDWILIHILENDKKLGEFLLLMEKKNRS